MKTILAITFLAFLQLVHCTTTITPGEIMVWFRNETSLQVLWQPPYPAGNFTDYTVSIEPRDSIHNPIQSVNFLHSPAQSDPISGVFHDLVPGRAYNISVETYSDGQDSDPIRVEAQYRMVPLRPHNVTFEQADIGPDYFSVRWSGPTGISEFNRYKVAIGSRRKTLQIIKKGQPLVARFTENLTPGRTYQVVVKTLSGTVASWPATGNVTTRPLPVRSIKEEQKAGPGSPRIVLTWQPNSESQQDSYRIEYNELEGFNGDSSSVTVEEPRFSIDKLQPGSSAKSSLNEVKDTMNSKGFVLISGKDMKHLLIQHGAREEDMAVLESGYIHKRLPADQQAAMYHRLTSCHRVLLNTTDHTIFNADTHTVTQYPVTEIASEEEDGAKIAYRRHGNRFCKLAPDMFARNSVSLAMARLNMILTPEVHTAQDNINIDNEITIDDQILIRTSRYPVEEDYISPTPEGRHQDNTEISSVTMIGRYNVTGGGETRLWDITAPTGNYDEEEFSRGEMDDKLILDHSLTEPWETVYFSDRKFKHEARAVTGDGPGPWVRDVIVNFIRKPVKDGTDAMLRKESLIAL